MEEQFGFDDLGGVIIEAVGDVVGGFGNNFANRADYESAVIDRINVNNRLALQSYADEARRKDETMSFLKNTTFIVLLVILALVVYKNVS